MRTCVAVLRPHPRLLLAEPVQCVVAPPSFPGALGTAAGGLQKPGWPCQGPHLRLQPWGFRRPGIGVWPHLGGGRGGSPGRWVGDPFPLSSSCPQEPVSWGSSVGQLGPGWASSWARGTPGHATSGWRPLGLDCRALRGRATGQSSGTPMAGPHCQPSQALPPSDTAWLWG